MDKSVRRFHELCLTVWNCYNCPVCYYIQNPDVMNNSPCMKCDSADFRAYFCLFCGHVGCSRNDHGHALAHFYDTKHRYVVELENLEVWDYKMSKIVHVFEDGQKLDKFHTYFSDNAISEPSCSCAICRHNQKPRLLRNSMCMKCEESLAGGLWICLQCGHVGCGRLSSGHALEHYRRTKHPQSMNEKNFSIWDYDKHAYLHRVLDNGNGIDNACEVKEREIEKRMNRLETKWNEFTKLTEANKKMLTIEQRLKILANEKKVLEGKLQEHDTKLNELIKQFIGSRKSSVTPPNNLNLRPHNIVINQLSASESNDEFKSFEYILPIIFMLFLYHLVMLSLQRTSENILKFF